MSQTETEPIIDLDSLEWTVDPALARQKYGGMPWPDDLRALTELVPVGSPGQEGFHFRSPQAAPEFVPSAPQPYRSPTHESDRAAIREAANRIAMRDLQRQPERDDDDGSKLGILVKAVAATALLATILRTNPGFVTRFRGQYFDGDEPDDGNTLVMPGPTITPPTEVAPAPTTIITEETLIPIVDDALPWYGTAEQTVRDIQAAPAPIYQGDEVGDYYAGHLRHQDHLQDASFRAATVQVLSPDGAEGSASLVEHDGQLYLRSIRHVMDMADYEGAEAPMFWVYMPGIGYTELPEYLLTFHEDGGDFSLGQDTNVLVPLRPALVTVLRERIADGTIAPLTIANTAAEAEGVESGYLVPNPETGGYISLTMTDAAEPADESSNTHRLAVTGYSLDNLADAERVANLICAGFSGSPVVDARNPSRTIGSVSSVSYNQEYFDGHNRICSVVVNVQEN